MKYYKKLNWNFSEGVIYIVHDGYLMAPYGCIVQLRRKSRMLNLHRDSVEELLRNIIKINSMDEQFLYKYSLNFSKAAYPNIDLLYKAPYEGLIEKLKMYDVLNLPLADALTKL
jgi:hypothetical protein